jgi:phage shock protein C
VNTRRLYRSRYDKQLAGVAGGMAEYLELDPTLVRILWILSVFLGGFTILLYVLLAFIVPLAPVVAAPGPSWAPAGPPADPGAGTTVDVSPTESWNTSQAGWAGATGAADATGAAGNPGPPGTAWTGSQGWTAPGPDVTADRRRGPGAAVYVGVLLVAFGTIALADAVIPGLAGISLAPALLVALGAALLIGSIRRPADEA